MHLFSHCECEGPGVGLSEHRVAVVDDVHRDRMVRPGVGSCGGPVICLVIGVPVVFQLRNHPAVREPLCRGMSSTSFNRAKSQRESVADLLLDLLQELRRR